MLPLSSALCSSKPHRGKKLIVNNIQIALYMHKYIARELDLSRARFNANFDFLKPAPFNSACMLYGVCLLLLCCSLSRCYDELHFHGEKYSN
jgi:hypothetical protein